MNSVKRSTIFLPKFMGIFVPRFAGTATVTSFGKIDKDNVASVSKDGVVFSKLQVATEAEYFYKMQLQQLRDLKDKDNITTKQFLQEQMKLHEDAMKRIRESMMQIQKTEVNT